MVGAGAGAHKEQERMKFRNNFPLVTGFMHRLLYSSGSDVINKFKNIAKSGKLLKTS